jgi:hypothetical protein
VHNNFVVKVVTKIYVKKSGQQHFVVNEVVKLVNAQFIFCVIKIIFFIKKNHIFYSNEINPKIILTFSNLYIYK